VCVCYRELLDDESDDFTTTSFSIHRTLSCCNYDHLHKRLVVVTLLRKANAAVAATALSGVLLCIADKTFLCF